MNYDYKKNRNVNSNRYNPFEGLIRGYINNSLDYEKFDTVSLDVSGQKAIYNDIYAFLNRFRSGDYKIYQHKELAALNSHLQTLGYKDSDDITREDLKNILSGVRVNIDEGSVRKDRVVSGGSSRYRRDGYESPPLSESSNYGESEESSFEYSTMAFRDYDVYMTYFKSMGFYIPNGWEIDFDYTNGLWYPERGSMNSVDNKRKRREWLWRKFVLIYVGRETYQTVQRIPLIGGLVNAADYSTSQRRGWFMLPTVAFLETINADLRHKMEQALRDNPFDEKEHFAVYRHGVPGEYDPNLTNPNEAYDWERDALFPGTKPWKELVENPYWSNYRSAKKAKKKQEKQSEDPNAWWNQEWW